jgi:hypothetical protein
VVGELKVCFEFDLADLARNFVGLARRNVHVLVVRSPLLEDLPTISACQGAIFSVCLHLRGAWERHITKGAFARLRSSVRNECHGSPFTKRLEEKMATRNYIPSRFLRVGVLVRQEKCTTHPELACYFLTQPAAHTAAHDIQAVHALIPRSGGVS